MFYLLLKASFFNFLGQLESKNYNIIIYIMNSNFQQLTINQSILYLFDKNVEASIYSEVLASDITPNLTEIPSTDTQQRRSGYFEMRPKAWLKSPERDQEKRLNRMYVEMLSTTTERQSYVDMSLGNPTPDP